MVRQVRERHGPGGVLHGGYANPRPGDAVEGGWAFCVLPASTLRIFTHRKLTSFKRTNRAVLCEVMAGSLCVNWNMSYEPKRRLEDGPTIKKHYVLLITHVPVDKLLVITSRKTTLGVLLKLVCFSINK